MQPRLKTSKKWTAFPKEYIDQIKEVFTETFSKKFGKGASISAEGRIYPEELLLRIGLLEKGRLAQANAEVSIAYNSKKENMVKLIYLAIDCAGSMLDEYFESKGEADFPRTWQMYDVQNKEVYLQFSSVNPRIEAEADKLLGVEKNDGLVGEEPTDEELDQVLGMLGLDGDDEDD